MNYNLERFLSRMRRMLRVIVGALDGNIEYDGGQRRVRLKDNYLLVFGPVFKVENARLPVEERGSGTPRGRGRLFNTDIKDCFMPRDPMTQFVPKATTEDIMRDWVPIKGVACKALAPANLRSEAIASGRGCSTLAARSNNVIRTAARFQSALPASFMAHSKVVARHEWSLSNQWQHGAARLFYESLRGSKRRTNRARWASLFNRRRADARYRRSTLQAWRRYSAG